MFASAQLVHMRLIARIAIVLALAAALLFAAMGGVATGLLWYSHGISIPLWIPAVVVLGVVVFAALHRPVRTLAAHLRRLVLAGCVVAALEVMVFSPLSAGRSVRVVPEIGEIHRAGSFEVRILEGDLWCSYSFFGSHGLADKYWWDASFGRFRTSGLSILLCIYNPPPPPGMAALVIDVVAPWWFACMILVSYPAWFLVRGSVRLRRRRRQGLCLACGYNLTGNTSGRCPECGREVGS